MAAQFFWTYQLPEEYLHTCPVLDQWTQPHSFRSLLTPLEHSIKSFHLMTINWKCLVSFEFIITTPPYISFHIRYVGWSCVLNCFMLSSLPCFYTFCWSAIPISCYVFYSCSCQFFLAADACLSWSLPSITEQQVSPHRLPMQYWLKNHWPDQAFFKHSPHTNRISNCVIITFRC